MTGIRMWFAAVGLVAMLGPSARAQGVAFLPIPAQFNDGANLNVTPVVSADRRYVRMSLTPQFNSINGFTTLPVPAAVGGGGNGGGLGGLGGGGGGGLGGLGGAAGGGGFRNQGIGALPRNAGAGSRPSAYRTGGSGAFAGAYAPGMTGGLDPLAEAVRQQMMMAALQQQQQQQAAASTPARTTRRRSTR